MSSNADAASDAPGLSKKTASREDAFPGLPQVGDARFNVALFVVDDLRADHLSYHGYARRTSPRLDERFKRGSYFRNCMTPTGWTLSACASILTGQLADGHGLVDHNRRFRAPKIGHFLGEAYHRAAFTNNGNTIPDDVSMEYLASLGHKRRPAKWRFFGWDDGFDEFHWTSRDEHLEPFARAGEFLDRQRGGGKPYFLFFHTNLVHDYHMDREYYLEVQDWLGRDVHPALRQFRDGPWVWKNCPPGMSLQEMKEDIVAKYDSGIRAMDAAIDGLLRRIDFERTIVIFVSDHGEGFEPEIGRVHHCGRLHQDLLRVPLALWLPPELRERWRMPAVEERFCSTIDVAPTVLTMLGVTVEGFPGRVLFDLAAHRMVHGLDRGYVYWNADCERESYDTARIEVRSELVYPLKRIEARKNDAVRRYAYNLAYDPGERDNLLDRRGRAAPELEPASFIVAVNDWQELEVNLLASPVASSPRHQWVLVDNRDNRAYDGISRLYFEAAERAENDLLFFMHQDLFLPEGWEERAAMALRDLKRRDPRWGVLGAVGAIPARENGDGPKVLKGHWCDPHGYFLHGPLPHEVESLDEQWLGLRRSSGVAFDPELPGFHCYGIDLSLSARELGRKSWAIDAFVWHKYADRRGGLIASKDDSPKIRERWSDGFMAEFNPSAEYVERKWGKFLPFQTTSWNWK
jgi:arylsulfatase A-like enzyme